MPKSPSARPSFADSGEVVVSRCDCHGCILSPHLDIGVGNNGRPLALVRETDNDLEQTRDFAKFVSRDAVIVRTIEIWNDSVEGGGGEETALFAAKVQVVESI